MSFRCLQFSQKMNENNSTIFVFFQEKITAEAVGGLSKPTLQLYSLYCRVCWPWLWPCSLLRATSFPHSRPPKIPILGLKTKFYVLSCTRLNISNFFQEEILWESSIKPLQLYSLYCRGLSKATSFIGIKSSLKPLQLYSLYCRGCWPSAEAVGRGRDHAASRGQPPSRFVLAVHRWRRRQAVHTVWLFATTYTGFSYWDWRIVLPVTGYSFWD